MLSDYEYKIHDRLTSQKIGSRDFWRIYNSFANKGKSSIPPQFHGPEVLTSSKDKAELFAKLFSTNSTLDDSGHPLPDFPHWTNIHLDNFEITTKKVAAVIAVLDPSKATDPYGIPVIVLQKCSPNFLQFFLNYMSSVLPSLVISLAGNFPLSFLFLRTRVRDLILAIIDL